MKRKKYKVRVKLIFETTMDHSQTSMKKAQEDVIRVLSDYLKNRKLNILNFLIFFPYYLHFILIKLQSINLFF